MGRSGVVTLPKPPYISYISIYYIACVGKTVPLLVEIGIFFIKAQSFVTKS